MKKILFGAAAIVLAATTAHAQTATTTNHSTTMAPPAGAPAAGAPAAGTSMGAPPTAAPTGAVRDDKAAASGNDNQAVVTTGANADQPAKGHNSFTMGQARHRIAKKGFSHVAGLKKDGDGVWRGTAEKDGQPVQVWLDYKGNVGQQS